MVLVAYLISSLIGFAIGHYFLEGAVAAYASILISYHLFLIYLIVSAEHEKGLSLPIFSTILTHLAFLALVVGIAWGRAHIPFFGVIRWLIPALAPFETKWLFSGKGKAVQTVQETPHDMATATIEEHEAFREHLHQKERPFRKPGLSLDEEFKLWMADRVKKRAEAEALAAAASAAPGASGNGGAVSAE